MQQYCKDQTGVARYSTRPDGKNTSEPAENLTEYADTAITELRLQHLLYKVRS